jgi:hypothetical protein
VEYEPENASKNKATPDKDTCHGKGNSKLEEASARWKDELTEWFGARSGGTGP